MEQLNSRHLPEIRRALTNFKFEKGPDGLYIPSMNRKFNGAFKHTLYRADGSRDTCIDPNLMVDEGLVYLLNAGFGAQAAQTAWYIALFQGNYTPVPGLTAATFDGQANELTGYTGDRKAWTVPVATTPSIGNTGSEALFVFDSSGPYTAYGAALLSVAGKEAITGKLGSASRFDTARPGLNSPDKLGVEYIVTAADAG